MSWRPRFRQVIYRERPEWVPEWVYVQAQVAKRQYNENWEFWVYTVSRDYNCSQAIAEDACIRGIKKEIDQLDFVYGPKIAKWFREYLDMDSVISLVKHPEYKDLKLEGV